ncbi:hypothetical protein POTOM_029691 [Populus tomentosa]|uniref:UVR domain-containing protein n=1 Tax=Populus tomentosa TaxID=118781 RepID=A0A8X7ZAI2_POPTO|nr:hypothetical protein POTOM_029691 [Populus tomentosa]
MSSLLGRLKLRYSLGSMKRRGDHVHRVKLEIKLQLVSYNYARICLDCFCFFTCSADVQNAIENENYAVAAGLRDQVSKLEAESFAASARAQAYENENAQYAFCLGQKVRHKIFGIKRICRDAFMPWEHILRTECYNSGLGVAYPVAMCQQFLHASFSFPDVSVVPEENLVAPEKPDLESFDHPYTSFLFYGMETPGDFILIKQLREKYNRPRQGVLPSGPLDFEIGGMELKSLWNSISVMYDLIALSSLVLLEISDVV